MTSMVKMAALGTAAREWNGWGGKNLQKGNGGPLAKDPMPSRDVKSRDDLGKKWRLKGGTHQ